MKQIIPIQEKDGKQLVSARNLYDALGYNNGQFSRWSKQHIVENAFSVENEDYARFDINVEGNIVSDFSLTLDFAKKLCMISKTKVGEQVRNYFIEVEKKAKQVAQLTPDQIIAQGFALAMKKVEVLEQENEVMKPKALFADTVTASSDCILIRELAKYLQNRGVKIGEKRLFEWMRENKYLISFGADYNTPTQKSMQLGLFQVKKTTITHSDGSTTVSTTSKVTGKGQVYFINKFMQGYNNQLIA